MTYLGTSSMHLPPCGYGSNNLVPWDSSPYKGFTPQSLLPSNESFTGAEPVNEIHVESDGFELLI